MSKNGLILLTPTSIAYTGGSSTATISANGSVAFSACATLSLNGVFTSDYDNYLLIMRTILDGSGAQDKALYMDFPPYTSSTFTVQLLSAASTTVSGSRSTSQTEFVVGRIDDAGLYSGSINYLYGPYLAQPTAHRLADASTGGSASIYDRAGTESSNTQHQNCRLYVSGLAPISGRVAVYGMRK